MLIFRPFYFEEAILWSFPEEIVSKIQCFPNVSLNDLTFYMAVSSYVDPQKK